MLDVQLLLNIVLIFLVMVLIVAVVYLIVILRDLRETIQKANTVLDDFQRVTNVISNPVNALSGLISAVTSGLKAFKKVKNYEEEEE